MAVLEGARSSADGADGTFDASNEKEGGAAFRQAGTRRIAPSCAEAPAGRRRRGAGAVNAGMRSRYMFHVSTRSNSE